MNPIQPLGTIDIHRGTQLALGERFRGTQVRRWHTPVRQCDLDVEDHGDEMRDEDEGDANGPGGQCAPEKQVAEDIPVACHEDDFDVARPPCCTELGGARGT